MIPARGHCTAQIGVSARFPIAVPPSAYFCALPRVLSFVSVVHDVFVCLQVAIVALEKSLLVREKILHPFNKVLLRTLR